MSRYFAYLLVVCFGLAHSSEAPPCEDGLTLATHIDLEMDPDTYSIQINGVSDGLIEVEIAIPEQYEGAEFWGLDVSQLISGEKTLTAPIRHWSENDNAKAWFLTKIPRETELVVTATYYSVSPVCHRRLTGMFVYKIPVGSAISSWAGYEDLSP